MGLVAASRAGWRAVRRSKRLLGLVALVNALICLVPSLYVGRVMPQSAAFSADASVLAGTRSESFFSDVTRVHAPGFHGHLDALVLGAFTLLFVVRPLIMGGYAGIASVKHRLHFDEFVREGGAVYWKFLRVALAAMAAMYLLSLAARPLLDYIDELAKERQSQLIAIDWRRRTEIVVFACFLAAATVLDYTRVGIHMYRRPGVFKELFRSALFVLQHPVKTLGFALVAFLLELALIGAAAPVFRWADGRYVLTSIAVFVLLQILVVLREGLRLFHLAGAYHLRTAEESDGPGPAGTAVGGEDADLLENLPWNED